MDEPTTTSTPRVGAAAFTFILVMVSFDMVAFEIIAPVLPDLIRQFEGGDFARASSITDHFDFVLRIEQQLRVHGGGAAAALACGGAHHFLHHHFQYLHGVRLCHGC